MASGNGQNAPLHHILVHLGIYKSLFKDVHTNDEKQQSNPQSKIKGVDIMRMTFQMLKTAVKYTHSFEWWCAIWNMFLENDSGSPKSS